MNIKQRNVVVSVILSLVTCGIYSIYWVVVMALDAVKIKDPSDSGTLEIVLMILLPFLGFFLTEKKLAEGCQERGIEHSDKSIVYLILGLFCGNLINSILMQIDLNEISASNVQ